MCNDFEAVSYLRLIDFVYHSTLGLRVMKKKKPRLVAAPNSLLAGIFYLQSETVFFINNLLVRIHFIIEMIR
jgi:hypothetical protein